MTIIIPGCDLLESLKKNEDVSYFISSFESLSNPEVSGSFTDNGAPASNLSVTKITASESQITFTLASPNLVRLTFSIPAKDGTYTIKEDVPFNEEGIEIYAEGYSFFGKSGTATVSSHKADILDGTRGKISFKLKGDGVFGGSDPRSIDRSIGFDLTVSFDNRNDPIASTPSNPGGSTGGTTGGATGGSGTASCVNFIDAKNLVSYWSQIKPGSASGTGRKVAGNTIFADYKSTDVALVIEATTAGTRYMVQIMLTGSNLVANKTLEFRNAGAGTGLTNTGAVGRLIAFNGTVNDDWRTNRDFGKNKPMGTLKILTVTPEITGEYSFQASGDGYPSLNNQFVNVSGTFCIKP
ncbi:MAG: hypothetical protein ACK4HU_00535 [Algoriphagus sp.]